MFWKVGLVTPDDPANAGVDKAEFMTGCVYRFDAGELEVPVRRQPAFFVIGERGNSPLVTPSLRIREWSNETSTCCVNVDGNTVARLLLVLV